MLPPVPSPGWWLWTAATAPVSRHIRAADVVKDCMVTPRRDLSQVIPLNVTIKVTFFKKKGKNIQNVLPVTNNASHKVVSMLNSVYILAYNNNKNNNRAIFLYYLAFKAK